MKTSKKITISSESTPNCTQPIYQCPDTKWQQDLNDQTGPVESTSNDGTPRFLKAVGLSKKPGNQNTRKSSRIRKPSFLYLESLQSSFNQETKTSSSRNEVKKKS